jgi:hypothetical protein
MSDRVPPPKVAFVTLGCGRNEVDSHNAAGLLAASGYELVDDPERADAVVVQHLCVHRGEVVRSQFSPRLRIPANWCIDAPHPGVAARSGASHGGASSWNAPPWS